MIKGWLFLLGAILFSFINVFGQLREPGNTYVDWDKIKIDSSYVPAKEDTSIIIITNRKFENTKHIKFSHDLQQEEKIHYLVAYWKNNEWIITCKNDFEQTTHSLTFHDDVLLYVHGDGKRFTDVLEAGIRMKKLYSVSYIAFDWPTRVDGLSSMENFYTSKKKLKRSKKCFEKFMLDFQSYRRNYEIDDRNYTLLLHSLGNEFMRQYILSDAEKPSDILFDNIIMNAPAVKQRKHAKWVQKINFQKSIYITSNKRDFVLTGAKLITLQNQLGEKYRKPLAKNAEYIKFDIIAGRKHNYFLDMELLNTHSNIYQFYNTLFHSNEIEPANHCILNNNNPKRKELVFHPDSSCRRN
ncbi:MAG: hypothetical protein ACK40G_14200 [Cytophagaceae bacterium]